MVAMSGSYASWRTVKTSCLKVVIRLLDNNQQHRLSVFLDKDLLIPTKLVGTIFIVSSCKAEETPYERGNNIEINNVPTSSNSPIATSS